ncbi:MAG: hypothetical protein KC589_05930 [Nanoarchaeota archaeon]|nr:hypothetical protein [Nanoarchaeota archaeon]
MSNTGFSLNNIIGYSFNNVRLINNTLSFISYNKREYFNFFDSEVICSDDLKKLENIKIDFAFYNECYYTNYNFGVEIEIHYKIYTFITKNDCINVLAINERQID